MTQLKTASHLVVVLHLTMERHKAKKWEVQTRQQKNVLHKIKTLKNKMYSALLAATRYWMLCYTRQSLDFQVGKLENKSVVAISPRNSDLS